MESPFKYLAPMQTPRPIFLPKRVGESPLGEAERRRRNFWRVMVVVGLVLILLAALFWSMKRYHRGGSPPGSALVPSVGFGVSPKQSSPQVYLNGVLRQPGQRFDVASSDRTPRPLVYYTPRPTPTP